MDNRTDLPIKQHASLDGDKQREGEKHSPLIPSPVLLACHLIQPSTLVSFIIDFDLVYPPPPLLRHHIIHIIHIKTTTPALQPASQTARDTNLSRPAQRSSRWHPTPFRLSFPPPLPLLCTFSPLEPVNPSLPIGVYASPSSSSSSCSALHFSSALPSFLLFVYADEGGGDGTRTPTAQQ